MAPARFVIIFAMAVATAHGADCVPSMKFKSNLGSLFCGGASTTVESCMYCCEPKDGYCRKLFLTKRCPDTHFPDYTKEDNEATDANFNAQCCTKKKTCGDVACDAGYKSIADRANRTCTGTVCLPHFFGQCCEYDPLTCLGAAGTARGDAKTMTEDAKTTLDAQIKACQDADKVTPTAKDGTRVKDDYTDYESQCCEAKVTCTAACPAGMKDKTGKATKKCSYKPCHRDDCCDDDYTTCINTRGDCPRKHFRDRTKDGNSVNTDGTDFNAQCCTLLATCSAFQAATSIQDASGSTRQMVATSSVLAMVGFILASKYI